MSKNIKKVLESIKILLIMVILPAVVNLFRYDHVCSRSVAHQDSDPVLVASTSCPFALLLLLSCINLQWARSDDARVVAIHQKLYFLPAGVASSPAGIGQDIDRQRTGGGAEVKAENSVLNGCPASRYLHAVYFYTWGSPPFE